MQKFVWDVRKLWYKTKGLVHVCVCGETHTAVVSLRCVSCGGWSGYCWFGTPGHRTHRYSLSDLTGTKNHIERTMLLTTTWKTSSLLLTVFGQRVFSGFASGHRFDIRKIFF